MKNYTLNDEDEKKFILKYEVEDDKIVLYLANGGLYSVPYTKDNEKRVLEMMKEQVENSNEFEEHLKLCAKIFLICSIVSSAVGIALTITTFAYFKWYYMVGSVVALLISKLTKKLENTMFETIEDIEKSKLVLEHEDSLNKNINKKNVLRNVSKKTLDVIKEIPDGKPVFDINTVDGMSLEDLKLIRENIARMEQFGFDNEEASPSYQKTFKKNKKTE